MISVLFDHHNYYICRMNWKDVKSYEGLYLVSDTGIVKSLPRNTTNGKIMSNKKEKGGYLSVILSKDGVVKTKKTHVLVAEAFIPNPKNKPQVNHIDGDKSNNNVNNLEWCTASENALHAYNVLNIKGGNSKYSDEFKLEIKKELLKGVGIRKLSRDFGVSTTTIYNIKNKT